MHVGELHDPHDPLIERLVSDNSVPNANLFLRRDMVEISIEQHVQMHERWPISNVFQVRPAFHCHPTPVTLRTPVTTVTSRFRPSKLVVHIVWRTSYGPLNWRWHNSHAGGCTGRMPIAWQYQKHFNFMFNVKPGGGCWTLPFTTLSTHDEGFMNHSTEQASRNASQSSNTLKDCKNAMTCTGNGLYLNRNSLLVMEMVSTLIYLDLKKGCACAVLVFVSVIVPTAYNSKNNTNSESLRTAGVHIYEKKLVFRQKPRIYIFFTHMTHLE